MKIEGGHMSKAYDFNGIKLWFADGYPSTREEAEGYFEHAQKKKHRAVIRESITGEGEKQ
jgi:hypothetical protein